jgi:hypothetical protein
MEEHHPEPPSQDRTMLRTSTAITAALLAAAALAPAAASAAQIDLGGQPTLRQVDAHHATLRFASDRLPRTPAGRIAARVVFSGERAGSVTAVGRHGDDVVYRARISTDRDLRAGAKYTVRIVVDGQEPIVRKVKLHAAR